MIQLHYTPMMVGQGTIILQRVINIIFPVYQKGRGKVFSVGLVFSRVPHQALYVLENLHLESSTKSCCCVAPHQALYGTLHLQSSIKKSSSESPRTFLFVTHLFILELDSLCQDLPLKQTVFPTATPA